MVSTNLIAQLEQATNRSEFTAIAEQHGLSLRASAKLPCVFAYVQGDFKNKVTSKPFCHTCGTGEGELIAVVEVAYCTKCNDSRLGAKEAHAQYRLEKDIADRDAELARERYFRTINDPFFNASHVPESVVRGERHDDKMAVFLNEY